VPLDDARRHSHAAERTRVQGLAPDRRRRRDDARDVRAHVRGRGRQGRQGGRAAAGLELADTGAGSVEAWKGHGATNVGWLDLADPAHAASEIRAARVIWFPGGVQTRLMDALHKAGVDGIVRERYAAGAVVGGTSAGAAVMTDVMITGDYDLTAMTPAAAPAPTSAPAPAPSADPAAQAPAGAAPRASQADEDSGLKYVRPGTNVFAHGLGLLPGRSSTSTSCAASASTACSRP
jgi:cyanophycinase-like exopeptidase